MNEFALKVSLTAESPLTNKLSSREQQPSTNTSVAESGDGSG